MMHASCPRGKEGKLIYGRSIFLFIFQLFLSDVIDIIRRQAPIQMETNVGSMSALSEGPSPNV